MSNTLRMLAKTQPNHEKRRFSLSIVKNKLSSCSLFFCFYFLPSKKKPSIGGRLLRFLDRKYTKKEETPVRSLCGSVETCRKAVHPREDAANDAPVCKSYDF